MREVRRESGPKLVRYVEGGHRVRACGGGREREGVRVESSLADCKIEIAEFTWVRLESASAPPCSESERTSRYPSHAPAADCKSHRARDSNAIQMPHEECGAQPHHPQLAPNREPSVRSAGFASTLHALKVRPGSRNDATLGEQGFTSQPLLTEIIGGSRGMTRLKASRVTSMLPLPLLLVLLLIRCSRRLASPG